jgi:hypothetical protein
MNNKWEIKRHDRHISAFCTNIVTVGNKEYIITLHVHKKYAPDMGGNNFSWAVKLDNLTIIGNGVELEECQSLCIQSQEHLINLYNFLYN